MTRSPALFRTPAPVGVVIGLCAAVTLVASCRTTPPTSVAGTAGEGGVRVPALPTAPRPTQVAAAQASGIHGTPAPPASSGDILGTTSRRIATPDPRALHGASSARVGPWYDWLDGDCIVEARLAEAYPERYNTQSGEPPYGIDPDTDAWTWGWMSFIPLRFEVEHVIWGDCPFDGFVYTQTRQMFSYETPTPPPRDRISPFAPWWVRPETLHSRPRGLAVLRIGMEAPPAAPSPDWDLHPLNEVSRFEHALADDLTEGDVQYVVADVRPWYEYVDGTAVSLIPSRELPVADLLAEVHEGLRLLGKE